ncbi:UNVERIFIED_CONTAM: hypothetical protein ABIC26_003587, partial [Paenibacillus sp. PvR008]
TNHSKVAVLEKQERNGSRSSFKYLSIGMVNRLEMSYTFNRSPFSGPSFLCENLRIPDHRLIGLFFYVTIFRQELLTVQICRYNKKIPAV